MTHHIVIGAGLAGAAAAYSLTARGEDVTVLERHTPANDRGSSHGSARIFRYAYPDRLYTDLVVRARELWDDLEAKSGIELITRTGALDFGDAQHTDLLAEIFDEVGVEYEVLDPESAAERWPQFAFDTDVLWHPDAGVIDAETTVTTMLDRAVDTGRARILTDWTVTEVARRSADGFRVTSAKGDIVEGDRVIVAAGGWLPDLLGDLGLPQAFHEALPTFEVRQEQAFHMPYRDVGADGRPSTDWPTFIHKSGEMFTYGLPGGRDAGFAGQKFAQFNGGKVIGSALDQDGQITEEMRTRMIDYAKRNLPGLIPEPYAETTCLFTNTPNEDFVIDEVDGLVIVSACSGHGAKFAPLLGEFAADLATGAGDVPDRFRVGGASTM
ncbi:sarcosine oxidase [Brevibacterium iodinum ATCC 49514]|uniref:Sarcosine oxidase n=1 Tax=Brevibacterium iodinum ATCC 49514 TaxID=1255616 RepID=A0A2H1HQ02_9MICO|nr:FAD-dependent oxidoreductase [Brevibacterium iodinum]SMX64999.1 sarcosine oxidase [Brevibacterium iodinum ATCC 49514]SUW13400.1 N-methyl-L-tryptophan oxidase [Brevibacterium iodinum]